MDLNQAIISGFQNYVGFSGRACRSEYWYWTLFIFLASLLFSFLDAFIFGIATEARPLSDGFALLMFLPGLAISIRRLHDIDFRGWWLLISFTVIGIIPLIIMACIKGTTGPNRFGPDPLEHAPPTG